MICRANLGRCRCNTNRDLRRDLQVREPIWLLVSLPDMGMGLETLGMGVRVEIGRVGLVRNGERLSEGE